MAYRPINLPVGQKAQRKLRATYVDVGDGSTPEWEIMGRSVEEANYEFDIDEETTTDILGITDTTVNKVTQKISMEPNYVRAGQKLVAKILDIYNRESWSELSMFKTLDVRAYIDGETGGSFEAWTYDASTIKMTSEGGAAYVGVPIEVTFGGNKVMGEVDIEPPGIPVFTATTTP